MAQPRQSQIQAITPAREACELLYSLMVSGPPVFPRVAAEFDLTPPQLHLLRLLGEGQSMPMRVVAEMLFCDASNVTSLVDRLEERKLIKRRPDPSDRRVKQIVLTKSGEALRTKALRKLYEPPAELSALSAADQRALRDILKRAVSLKEA
ncbi:MAG: MarR family transcriptional regulator [Thermoleophilaceae bacterium]|nr:MarR family transcriptional regulator [Thermoleophilaceae bacterium]